MNINCIGVFDHKLALGQTIAANGNVELFRQLGHNINTVSVTCGELIEIAQTKYKLQVPFSSATIGYHHWQPTISPTDIDWLHANTQLWNANQYNIAFWTWEVQGYLFENAVHAATLFDAIVVPSEFVKGCIAPYVDCPVYVVQHHIPFNPPADLRVDNNLPFTFLAVGDVFNDWAFARKNLQGAINAFQLAFEGGPTPILKVRARRCKTKLLHTNPNIQFVDDTYDISQLGQQYRGIDCLISLHRSEGFGLHIAECMALGIPVIASRFGGNLQYCNDSNAMLIDGDIVSVKQHFPAFEGRDAGTWLDPSISQTITRMIAISRNPAGYLTMRQNAIVSIADNNAKCINQMRSMLDNVVQL